MRRDTDASKHDCETPIYGFTEKLLAYLWFCFIAAALIYPILNGSTVQEIMSLLNDGGFPLVAFILGPPFILLYRRDLGNFVQTYRNATTIADDIEKVGDQIKGIGIGVSNDLRKEAEKIGNTLRDNLTEVINKLPEQVSSQIDEQLKKQLSTQAEDFSGGVTQSIEGLLKSTQERIEDTFRKGIDQISKSAADDGELELNDSEANSDDQQKINDLRNKYHQIARTAVNIFNPLHSAIYLKNDGGKVPLVSRGGGNRKDIAKEFSGAFIDELVQLSQGNDPISREEAERIVGFMIQVFEDFGIRNRRNVDDVKAIVDQLELRLNEISRELAKAKGAVS